VLCCKLKGSEPRNILGQSSLLSLSREREEGGSKIGDETIDSERNASFANKEESHGTGPLLGGVKVNNPDSYLIHWLYVTLLK
jgi:hypothetical protein